jgi:hypothetical protein
VSDEPLDPISILQLGPQVGVLGLEPALFERGSNDVQQRIELEWLRDEVRRAVLDRLDGILDRSVTRNDDRDDFRVALERRIDDLAAVDPGQAQVRDKDVEGEVTQARDGLLPAVGLLDGKPVIHEPLRHCFTQRRLVVDDEQMLLAFGHLVGRRYFDIPTAPGQCDA